MNHLASFYFDIRKYNSTELLYRYVARARHNTLGPCRLDTLNTYLDIVGTISYQGRYPHAMSLHQDLNSTIQDLFDPWYELAVQSKSLLANMRYNLGETAGTEAGKGNLAN